MLLRPLTAEPGQTEREPLQAASPASPASPATAEVARLAAGPSLLQEPPRRPWLGNSNAIAAVWLIGSLTCLLLAAAMVVGENRRVYVLGWSSPLPETCWTYSRFGIDCPGCGLTRTFVHMAHGQLSQAWRLSPVGCFMFLFACLQIPPSVAQLLFRARNRWVEAWGAWNDWGTACLMGALVLQWLVRLGERMLT